MVACPTPVRAAEDWLEPRDTEEGEKENQTWINRGETRAGRTQSLPRCVFMLRVVIIIWTSSVRSLENARCARLVVCLKLMCNSHSAGLGPSFIYLKTIIFKKNIRVWNVKRNTLRCVFAT